MATGAVWIIIASLVVWWGSLSNGFHYDDEHSATSNYHIRSLSDPWRFFSDIEQFSVDADKAMYRPLVVLSLALNCAMSGNDEWSYHATNVVIHIGCALVVAWCAVLLGGPASGACLAGLLMAMHPACSEVVNYVSARSDGMATLFGLVAVGLWIRR